MSKRKRESKPFRTRFQPQGCYADCAAKDVCQSERFGLCPDPIDIPVWEMKEPNTWCVYFDSLRYGRRDYDNEITEYYKWVRRYKKHGGPKPPDSWRDTLDPPDPWADKLITLDPTFTSYDPAGGYPYVLYDGSDFQEHLFDYPPLYDAILNRVRKGQFDSEFLYEQMNKVIRTFFEDHYKDRALQDVPPEKRDEHWITVKKYFWRTTTLLSKCTIGFYFRCQGEMVGKVAMYANLPTDWEREVDRRLAQRKVTSLSFRGSPEQGINPESEAQINGIGIAPKPAAGKSSFSFKNKG